jgi:uncharacterized Zn finger protein (UPF0148 family)
MGNIFCPACGSKSTYNLSPPNFCSKCGSAYNSTFITNDSDLNKRMPSRRAASSRLQRQQVEDEEEFDDDTDESEGGARVVGGYFSDSTRVPRINKIAVDIDCSTDVRTFKLSDIIKDINDAESI